MKKSIVALLSLLLGASAVFSACGSPAAPSKTDAPAATQAAAEDTAPAETQAAADDTANTAPADGKIKVGVAMSEYNDKWLSYMLDAMHKTAETYEAEGVEFMWSDGKNDINTQIGQIEDFITNGCNAIVVVPVNTDATEQISQACEEANVKLIFVNRRPNTSYTSYVGSDSKVSGVLEMEYLGEKMGGKGKIVILQGQPGQEAATLRTEGFKEVIKDKFPDIEIVAEDHGDWQRDKAQSIVETWIQNGTEFDAIASNNDEMAIGAILALESAGKTGVLVGGIDATIDGLDYLKSGKLAVTVFQNANGQGSGAIETAVKAARGEPVEALIDIPYELVKPEQVDEYIAKWQ